MKPESRCTEGLLVLTGNLHEGVAILDWRPFKSGNTLGEIVTAHNLRCEGSLREKPSRLSDDCLPYASPLLTIVSPGPAGVRLLQPERQRGIKIVLLDLDAVDANARWLEPIKDYLSRQQCLLHLIQISRIPQAESCAAFLEDTTCVSKSSPEVYQKQSQLEAFLHAFRRAHRDAWQGAAQNPFDTLCSSSVFSEPYVHPRHGHFMNPQGEMGRSIRRLYRGYREALPATMAHARDIAMVRRFSEEQTTNLGRAAAIQEFLLLLVKELVRSHSDSPVSVDAIRKPLFDVPVDQPFELSGLRPVRLVELHLTQSRSQLTSVQCDTLADLGISGRVTAMVHFDRPDVWDRVRELHDLLTVNAFTVELPGWDLGPPPCDVGLNEVSFGVRIEESFSRSLDSSHASGEDEPIGAADWYNPCY